MTGRNWMVYDEQIKSYINKGFTKELAIQKVQELYQTNMQASATSGVGLDIAAALLASRR